MSKTARLAGSLAGEGAMVAVEAVAAGSVDSDVVWASRYSSR
jgi:hypothetical protein